MNTAERSAILKKRDMKARVHLEQYAPVWLTEEHIVEEDDTVVFNVVFQHNLYGWVNRRYRYDAFNDVLYMLGELQLKEGNVMPVIEKEPFLTTTVPDITNAYGG